MRFKKFILIEDVIEVVEKAASSEVFSVLKRVDEKSVTETAYHNPKFVEDIVRDVAASLRDEVLAGLKAWPRSIPPKFFYDERGSQLFDRICEQPEYYQTRTEMAILRRALPELVAGLAPDLIVLTGDFLNTSYSEDPRALEEVHADSLLVGLRRVAVRARAQEPHLRLRAAQLERVGPVADHGAGGQGRRGLRTSGPRLGSRATLAQRCDAGRRAARRGRFPMRAPTGRTRRVGRA